MAEGLASFSDVFVTHDLDDRPPSTIDPAKERDALQELVTRLADHPEGLLPCFVDLAMEITGGVSAGISQCETEGGIFRWRHLRGALSRFDGAAAPHDGSPCAVTLDLNEATLCRHPERAYVWISDAGVVVPEVLLVPLHFVGKVPTATLWIVSNTVGHFDRAHVRCLTELSRFVCLGLRMKAAELQLQRDVHEQRLIALEMSHRLKNLFSIVGAVALLSAKEAATPRDMAMGLSQRLRALASAHDLALGEPKTGACDGRPVALMDVIAAVIAPYQDGDRTRCSHAGPLIGCGEHCRSAIALVFHELATNAAKYGALSAEGGRVAIGWRHVDDTLLISWTETGGPAVRGAPSADGFGQSLVRKTVVGQLGGDLVYDWREEGLSILMSMPASRLAV